MFNIEMSTGAPKELISLQNDIYRRLTGKDLPNLDENQYLTNIWIATNFHFLNMMHINLKLLYRETKNLRHFTKCISGLIFHEYIHNILHEEGYLRGGCKCTKGNEYCETCNTINNILSNRKLKFRHRKKTIARLVERNYRISMTKMG